MEKVLRSRTKAEVDKIRNSRAWRNRTRPEQLRRFPQCQRCEKKGILKGAKEVDHIIPLEQGGEPLDFKNLQSLCFACHVKKSAEENRLRKSTKIVE
ncbi:MAG: HNH endonuclease [Dyadobacter sp.]|uniref:HNH endonuclease signature motif containing protein n=1 Tax=Dyadobacter sp. TaxID=1914288 RepID=UPI001B1BA83B|nr:HNH endonuclease [Dyadobacter sp.]